MKLQVAMNPKRWIIYNYIMIGLAVITYLLWIVFVNKFVEPTLKALLVEVLMIMPLGITIGNSIGGSLERVKTWKEIERLNKLYANQPRIN